jgi:hypothetical protein
LRKKNLASFEEGFPLTILLHAKDIIENREGWVDAELKYLKSRGARRFIFLSELALRLNLVPEVSLNASSSAITVRLNLEPWHFKATHTSIKLDYSFWVAFPHGHEVAALDPRLQVLRHDHNRKAMLFAIDLSNANPGEKEYFIQLNDLTQEL